MWITALELGQPNRFMKKIIALLVVACGLYAYSQTSVTHTSLMGIQTQGDGSPTLAVATNTVTQLFSATLTGNRTITLSTAGAVNGTTFKIVRKGLGLFTLDVGGLKTVPSATTATVDVMYDGSAWQLIGYQLL